VTDDRHRSIGDRRRFDTAKVVVLCKGARQKPFHIGADLAVLQVHTCGHMASRNEHATNLIEAAPLASFFQVVCDPAVGVGLEPGLKLLPTGRLEAKGIRFFVIAGDVPGNGV